MGQPEERRRLLVVDDEEENRSLIARTFRSEFEIHQAPDGDRGLEAARRIRPHVVVADQRMPGLTGVELLARIKEELPRTVRILLTGYANYGALMDAVNAAGVHHYVEKPFHTVDLRTVVETLVRTMALEAEREDLVRQLQEQNEQLRQQEALLKVRVQERTRELADTNRQLKEANRQLEQLATRDGLTGAFNHRYAQEHIRIEVERAKRYGRTFSVLFLDLDNFKLVNDLHGHQVGDQVLRRIGELLGPGNARMRRSDVVARYGGEEFLVLLPETDADGARIKAERIRELVAKEDWTGLGIAGRRITVSIGVATYPEHGKDAETLVGLADEALYAAKRAGKNRVVVTGSDRGATP